MQSWASWQKQALCFSHDELKVSDLDSPIHFVCNFIFLGRHYTTRRHVAAILHLGEYGQFSHLAPGLGLFSKKLTNFGSQTSLFSASFPPPPPPRPISDLKKNDEFRCAKAPFC